MFSGKGEKPWQVFPPRGTMGRQGEVMENMTGAYKEYCWAQLSNLNGPNLKLNGQGHKQAQHFNSNGRVKLKNGGDRETPFTGLPAPGLGLIHFKCVLDAGLLLDRLLCRLPASAGVNHALSCSLIALHMWNVSV
ncbi:hypothetical protein PoB_000683400 [Plakobranchus ocellatus]|uniref:Uncharacterized protein n=1 Tax=Plakobranchus ocellatus TaxID=259542 RepID=A0AAV3YDJ2_9GAST|nr:hypothetical protein PoB_000683400 [Plakobranchus ocellatus]